MIWTGKIALSLALAICYSVCVWWKTIPSITHHSSLNWRRGNVDAISPIEPERRDRQNELSSLRTMQHRNLEEKRPSSSSSSPMRILMGIFTTNSEEDATRRRLIRKTYLQAFHVLGEVGLTSDIETSSAICSLTDLIENKGNVEETCLIVYTFVMGAWDKSNATAPTDLTLMDDKSATYTVDRSFSQDYERDVIYLNIRENMNLGKSETWLRYASTILPTTKLGIDLIFKVDSDTVVSPRRLLSDLKSSVFTPDRRKHPLTGVYGGAAEVGRSNQVLYMQGGFYFFSLDVARQITSKDCARPQIIQEKRYNRGYERSEDVDIGNFVAYCWEKQAQLNRVLLNRNTAVHGIVYKEAARFRVRWKETLARDVAVLRFEQVKETFGGHCPTEEQDRNEVMNWFDMHPNMKLAKVHFQKIC